MRKHFNKRNERLFSRLTESRLSEQPSRLQKIYAFAHKKWETDGSGEWDENELESELLFMLEDGMITQEELQAVLDAYNMRQRK
jgi:hypothetical protein